MPYIKFPNKQELVAALAPQVGKALGMLKQKVLSKLFEVIDDFRRAGCPHLQKLNQISRTISQMQRVINSTAKKTNRVKKMATRLKAPLIGLEVAINVIGNIPIPQAVPPGIGIPISITNKFTEQLILLLEMIAAIKEKVDSIEAMVQPSILFIDNINKKVQSVKLPVIACKIENALKEEVTNGKLTEEQLIAAGLLNDKGEYIFTSLIPIFLGTTQFNTDGSTYYPNNNEQQELSAQSEAADLLNSAIELLPSLDDSNSLKDLIDTYQSASDRRTGNLADTQYSHIGPDGTVYKLNVELDVEGSTIAPQRFAVAKNLNNIVVLRGAKSYSSSETVLIDEIKFRIDNQLA